MREEFIKLIDERIKEYHRPKPTMSTEEFNKRAKELGWLVSFPIAEVEYKPAECSIHLK